MTPDDDAVGVGDSRYPVGHFLNPACPGEDCMMCNGEACHKCGAGCWNNNPKQRCEHDVLERHEEPR